MRAAERAAPSPWERGLRCRVRVRRRRPPLGLRVPRGLVLLALGAGFPEPGRSPALRRAGGRGASRGRGRRCPGRLTSQVTDCPRGRAEPPWTWQPGRVQPGAGARSQPQARAAEPLRPAARETRAPRRRDSEAGGSAGAPARRG